MYQNEPIDYDDPRSLLEKQEESSTLRSGDEFISALSRLLAWQIEGSTPERIGMRTLVICHTIRPEIINGLTLDEIGKMFGFYGRSAIHKVSKDFTSTFNIHGIHQRSQETKQKLSKAWHTRNARLQAKQTPG